MKSLLDLPSKEFVDFIGTVKDYQQTGRWQCTFWLDGVACFCSIILFPWAVHAKIQPIDSSHDIGTGCGCAVEKEFTMDNTQASVDGIWEPTCVLRWRIKARDFDPINSDRVLQQLWKGNNGGREWRDIETVEIIDDNPS